MPVHHKQFLVIGLGRFGSSVATALGESGNEVLAVDIDEQRVAAVADQVTHALQCDCTDQEALHALGARNFDVAIVTIGDNIQSSILVTMLLKEMGVKKVIAKAKGALHARVLIKTGADQVVQPERDMGERLAHSLTAKNVVDVIELSNNYALGEIRVPRAWVGKTLGELHLRENNGINIVAVRRNQEMQASLSSKSMLLENDELIIIGTRGDVQKIEDL